MLQKYKTLYIVFRTNCDDFLCDKEQHVSKYEIIQQNHILQLRHHMLSTTVLILVLKIQNKFCIKFAWPKKKTTLKHKN